MSITEILAQIEGAGITFRLDGDRVRVCFPDSERRNELAGQVAFLRAHREEVAVILRKRMSIPPIPPGVRLISWALREPPVAIETAAVVVMPALFAETTLVQLGTLLANPRRSVGWSIPQLIDRLSQVGVTVALSVDELATSQKPS